MGFSHLVNIDATIVAFKAMFYIPLDVQIQYYPEGDIENDRLLRVIFIPIMSVLKCGIRFSLDPFY